MLQDVASDMLHMDIVTTQSYVKMVKQLCPSVDGKSINWDRLESFIDYRIDPNAPLVDWLDVPASKMKDRFHLATALYSTESAFNADRDLTTGALKHTAHSSAAIDRDQGGMWSPDVAISEAKHERVFVNIFTKKTVRFLLPLPASHSVQPYFYHAYARLCV